MTTLEEIRSVARKLGAEFGAQQVILFGSYADGTATATSDVDLLVIMPNVRGNSLRVASEMLQKVQPRWSVDIVVRGANDLKRRIREGDPFLRDAVNSGTVIYEDAHA